MLPFGLERVIQQGKAKFQTFSFGAGGVGRIPVPQNSFIIITHFDYFNFADIPQGAGTGSSLASFTATWGTLAPATINSTPFSATLNFFAFGVTSPFTLDPNNVALSQFNVNQALSSLALFPGLQATLSFAPVTYTWTFSFFTTTPGTAFNGRSVTLIPSIAFTATTAPAIFAGGTASTITIQTVLDRSVHQLEFRSSKSRNHYIVRDDVTIFDGAQIGVASFFINVNGKYSKDCYLVHTDNVKIDIVTVPPQNNWSTSYVQLSAKSEEDAQPTGYGVSPAGQNTVRAMLFDAPGSTQEYLPLTAEFADLNPVTNQYTGQFHVAVNTLNKLNNPKGVSGLSWNRANYPIVNIDYVLVEMQYNEFVKSST